MCRRPRRPCRASQFRHLESSASSAAIGSDRSSTGASYGHSARSSFCWSGARSRRAIARHISGCCGRWRSRWWRLASIRSCLESSSEFPSEGAPYPIFLLCGLVPWNFITRSVLAMTGSILSDQDLVKRVYFPRLVIPISALAQAFSNTFFGLVLLVAGLFYYGIMPPEAIVLAPAFLALAGSAALGLGLIAAALNVRFRDVGYVMPVAMQTLLFLTPVIYPATLLPDSWRLVYALNPAVGIIGGLRWSLLGIPADPLVILISTTTALGLLLAGLWYFARSEDSFADLI